MVSDEMVAFVILGSHGVEFVIRRSSGGDETVEEEICPLSVGVAVGRVAGPAAAAPRTAAYVSGDRPGGSGRPQCRCNPHAATGYWRAVAGADAEVACVQHTWP